MGDSPPVFGIGLLIYKKHNKMNNFSKLSSHRLQINFLLKNLLIRFMRFTAGNEQIPFSDAEIALFYLTATTILTCLLLLFFFI
jgi:hypothetical protein